MAVYFSKKMTETAKATETLVYAVRHSADLGLFAENDPLVECLSFPGNDNNVVPLLIPAEFVEIHGGRPKVQGRLTMVPGFGDTVVVHWTAPGEEIPSLSFST
jgi:hypothetical protein